MKHITRQEELILLSVFRLKEESYLVKIRKYLNNNTDRNWSISSVYIPLDRLKKLGYLETEIGEPTAKRGGKAIKYYQLTKRGAAVLAELKKVNDFMWNGVDERTLQEKF